MKIVDLASGRVSLEFVAAEREIVLAEIRERCGAYQMHGAYEMQTARGERFVYMNEWDEPCLISAGPVGDAVLRQIAGDRVQARTA